jgi:Fe-S-cluster containining protein
MDRVWECCHRGDCCTQPAGVLMTTSERDLLLATSERPMVFSEPDGLGFVTLTAHPCPLHDAAAGCTVYDVRPFQCRRYSCGRSGDEEWSPEAVPARFYTDRAFRRQMVLDQRKSQRWARAHGWEAQ